MLKLLTKFALVIMLLIYPIVSQAAIKAGDKGPEVVELQRVLIAKGLLDGKADGICGPATVAAIERFQLVSGLEVDGICGTATYNLLVGSNEISDSNNSGDSNYYISLGSRGADVEELQNILIALGYMSGTADGVCGPATVEAIRRVQMNYGLTADGVCGTSTFDAINLEAEIFVANGYNAAVKHDEQVETFDSTEQYPTQIANGGYAEIGSVIKPGMHGEGVVDVQNKLIKRGFLKGVADGVCGEATVAAIKKFQQSKGLTADGVCGIMTYAALEDAQYGGSRRDNDEWKKETENFPQFKRTLRVTATAYSPQDPGLGKYTARGHRVSRGIIAVDPRVIPLGTRVYIPGYGEAVADDTGGAIKGNRIDIAFDTHREAINFGRQTIDIYIIDD